MAIRSEIIVKWGKVLDDKNVFYPTYVALKKASKKRPLGNIEKEQLLVVTDALRPSFTDVVPCILLSLRYEIDLPPLD